MIDTIIFDIGNVILPFDFGIFVSKFAEISGFGNEYITQVYFGSGLKEKMDKGKIGKYDFYRKSCKALKIKIDYEEFEKIWSNIFTEDKKVTELIRFLKKEGYYLILFSDTDEIHYEYFRNEYDFTSLFDKEILSFKTGYLKTEEQAYPVLIENLKSLPENAVFIDDKRENLNAASVYNVKCIHFAGFDSLKKDLSLMGVLNQL